MKLKVFVLCLAAILVLPYVMCGCSNNDGKASADKQSVSSHNNASNQQTNKDELELALDKAAEFTQYLKDGQFDKVYNAFGTKLKESVSEQELKRIITTLTDGIGSFVELTKDSVSKHDSQYVVANITLQYQHNGITFKYTLNDDYTIEGFFCNYSGKSSVGDSLRSHSYEEIQLILGEYELEGILTLPKNKKNPECVVLVQGSGSSDMDETVGSAANKPFRDIAHTLSENGIATIRFNKRFFQDPSLAGENITIEQEVLEDVNAALDFARNTGYVNPKKIFVLGHSMGGMLVPKIAKDNPFVAGIVIMAGTPRTLADVMYDQNIASLSADTTMSQKDKDSMALYVAQQRDNANSATADGTQKPFGIDDSYFYSLNNACSVEILQSTDIPMFIIQGSDDFQISAQKDFALYKELLKDKTNVKFRLYDGLNHLFMKSGGKKDLTEYNTKANVDATVLSDIVDFITNAHTLVQNNSQPNRDDINDSTQALPEQNDSAQNQPDSQNNNSLNLQGDQNEIEIDMSDLPEGFFD